MRGGARRSYSIFFRSVWQMPQASTRTRISPAPMRGVGTSSMATTDRPLYTAALMAPGTPGAASTASEVAVCNKLSKRLRSRSATPPKLEQLRSDGDRAGDRSRQDARRAETAVRTPDSIEIDMKRLVCQIRYGTDTVKWHSPFSHSREHSRSFHFHRLGSGAA